MEVWQREILRGKSSAGFVSWISYINSKILAISVISLGLNLILLASSRQSLSYTKAWRSETQKAVKSNLAR